MTIQTRAGDPDIANEIFHTRAVSIDFEEGSLGERLIKGYASIFNERDSYGDYIRPGAFDRTLEEEFPKKRVKFLYQHKWDHPLGVPSVLKVDKKGLWSEVEVIQTTRGDDALLEAKSQAVDGLSIGFWVRQSRLIDDDGEPLDESEASWWDMLQADREILVLKLGEYSLVTFPAAENARVEEVRAMRRKLEYSEDLLRRSNGSPQFATAHVIELVTELREIKDILLRGANPATIHNPPPVEAQRQVPTPQEDPEALIKGLNEIGGELDSLIAKARTT